MTTDEPHLPRWRVDDTGRVVPANAAAQQRTRELDERDRTEPPPWSWMGGPRRPDRWDGRNDDWSSDAA